MTLLTLASLPQTSKTPWRPNKTDNERRQTASSQNRPILQIRTLQSQHKVDLLLCQKVCTYCKPHSQNYVAFIPSYPSYINSENVYPLTVCFCPSSFVHLPGNCNWNIKCEQWPLRGVCMWCHSASANFPLEVSMTNQIETKGNKNASGAICISVANQAILCIYLVSFSIADLCIPSICRHESSQISYNLRLNAENHTGQSK